MLAETTSEITEKPPLPPYVTSLVFLYSHYYYFHGNYAYPGTYHFSIYTSLTTAISAQHHISWIQILQDSCEVGQVYYLPSRKKKNPKEMEKLHILEDWWLQLRSLKSQVNALTIRLCACSETSQPGNALCKFTPRNSTTELRQKS